MARADAPSSLLKAQAGVIQEFPLRIAPRATLFRRVLLQMEDVPPSGTVKIRFGSNGPDLFSCHLIVTLLGLWHDLQ